MKDFLAWLMGWRFLKVSYKFLGWPGVFIFVAAEGGLVVSLVLLILVLSGFLQ